MSSRWRGRSRLLSVFAIVAMLTMPTMGVAREPGAAGDAVVSSGAQVTTVAEQQRIRDYWTPARMRAAKPMPLPASSAGSAPTGVTQAGPSGAPGSVMGSRPEADEGDAFSVSGVQPVGYSYPFPFTRFNMENGLTKSNPYRTVGKMFFSQGSGNFVCSGAAVPGSSSQSVVYTAGHCVSNGAGTFSTNVLFVPGRRPTGASTPPIDPYGSFPGLTLVTTTDWHFNFDLTRDLGAYNVGTNANGQHLQNLTGFLGFAWNQSRVQHWDAFGYPQAAPFNGQTMVRCEASHAVDDTGILGGGPDPIGIGCDMTGGSSGGPWIMGLRSSNFHNSVNSYKYTTPSQPLAMYGPYFDDLANTVRCVAAGTGGVGC